MNAIYKPKGRAGEYAELACNLYTGCQHGCSYCYAPLVLHKERGEFHAACILRPGIMGALRKDALSMFIAGDKTPVLLCFTCDPYGVEDTTPTRQALEILHLNKIPFNVLTKNWKAARDFDLYKDGDKFGMTLTFKSMEKSLQWEPNASSPQSRLNILQGAKHADISTWASIEPVIEPAESLTIMAEAMDYVDHFKIGKLNHHPIAKEIDWKRFANEAVELCERNNKPYTLKDDLKKYLEGQA